MDKQNRFYLLIIIAAVFLTVINISIARNDSDYTLFDPLVDVVDLVQRYYVSETDQQELITDAINGMLHELDPYSEYIPAQDLQEFDKQTSGSYEGIGVGIDVQQNHIVVISPFEDSPAYQAGMLPGDIILEVDGDSTKGFSATQAVKKLTGPAGTKVTLKILHRDGKEEDITITRQKIRVHTIRGWRRSPIDGSWDYLLDAESKMGYLRISQFTEDTVADLDQAVEKLRQQDMQALIMDLRQNPGGLMTAAVETVDRFIDHGVILSTKGAHTSRQVQMAHAPGTYPRFHLVVLIDEGSASASEIVAGSLQDHDRAVLVGERSWGKGSVQRIIKLSDTGAAVKLTTDHYYLPKGRCVHRLPGAKDWGVTPDVEEAFSIKDVAKYRQLLDELILNPLTQAKQKENNNHQQEKSPPAEDTQNVKELAQKLLALDSQLAQAVKQCKGLIRTKPTLPVLAETITDYESPPAPESDTNNKKEDLAPEEEILPKPKR